MSEGTLGFLPKGSSQVYRQHILEFPLPRVRALRLLLTCMKGLPAQDTQAKLWMRSSRHAGQCLWAAWGAEQL